MRASWSLCTLTRRLIFKEPRVPERAGPHLGVGRGVAAHRHRGAPPRGRRARRVGRRRPGRGRGDRGSRCCALVRRVEWNARRAAAWRIGYVSLSLCARGGRVGNV